MTRVRIVAMCCDVRITLVGHHHGHHCRVQASLHSASPRHAAEGDGEKVRKSLLILILVSRQKDICCRYLMSEEMKNEVIPSLQRATNQHVAMKGWSKEKATK